MDIISFNEASTANGRIENFIENPDSSSGVVTVPKVIASGETITIPAGRVAVLPNVQVDGTLNIEGEVFIPSGSTFDKVVETEGNQTISGVKTFTSSPIVPTPTTGTQAVNKDYADTKTTLVEANSYDIGVGQTWQDVTASRVLGTTYTNSTGKPIIISVNANNTTTGSFGFIGSVNGNLIVTNVADGTATTGFLTSIFFIVPPGQTYSVTKSGGASQTNTWKELR